MHYQAAIPMFDVANFSGTCWILYDIFTKYYEQELFVKKIKYEEKMRYAVNRL